LGYVRIREIAGYVRMMLNLSRGEHIRYCVTSEDKILCNCVGDEFMIWVMSLEANRLYKERRKGGNAEIVSTDIEDVNLFQGELSEEFMTIDEKGNISVNKECGLYGWHSLESKNLSPCDWFVKFDNAIK